MGPNTQWARQNNIDLFESSPDPMLVIGPEGRVQQYNRAAKELFYSSTDSSTFGFHIEGIPGLQGAAVLETARLRLRAGERVGGLRGLWRAPDGSFHWYEWSAAPLQGGLALAIGRDVTHYLQGGGAFSLAEPRVRYTAAKRGLKAHEDHFRTLSKVAPIGIFQADVAMTLTYVNGRFIEISGRSEAELQRHGWLANIHPEDREPFRLAMERAREQSRPLRHEHRILGRTGEIVWVALHAVPELSDEWELLGWIGTLCDITDTRTAQAELTACHEQLETMVARRTGELERLNQELESFNYTVSHDLRAPLRAMAGFAGALREEYSQHLDGIGQRYIDRIQANADHMARLIEDLLELSRVGQLELKSETVDVTRMARSIMSEFGEGHPERQVNVQIEEGLFAWADPRLLRCLLQNLIANAWKYTGQEVAPVIELGAESVTENAAVFFIRDNGVGFSMSAGTALFRPFQRLHPASEFEGSGIGLAIVQRIANRLGGRVWAEGVEGQGAIFRFELPTAPPD